MNPVSFSIASLEPEDWPSVRSIYLEGIASGRATFETEAPSWDVWNASHRSAPRLKVSDGSRVIGWAALGPVSRRPAYAGVAEVSIYVSADSQGHGVGTRLLTALVSSSEDAGIWSLQAGIFAITAPSIALHERCGFRIVGIRERIGQLHGTWQDIVLMERRSLRVGLAEPGTA
jgi:L-amino acid N-acyltransferase YncA